MKAFNRHQGSVIPLDRANVDTDQIIPKQFLKSIHRTGFGDYLFDGWRFLDEGELGKTPNERRINPDFILNDARYQGASILLAQENFGCGSSREHAVWALQEYGINVVIAPKFADIFYSNCAKNGLLAIVIEDKICDRLFELAQREKALTLAVDLDSQRLTVVDGGAGEENWTFDIEAERKRKLIEGVDDIADTLMQADAIKAFEAQHRQRMPWLFDRL